MKPAPLAVTTSMFTATLSKRQMSSPGATSSSTSLLWTAACVAAALCLLGYHPYAEDGAIYSAATALRLDDSLFPSQHALVTAQTSRTLFVPLLAGLARGLHLSLAVTMWCVFIASVAATVMAAAKLAGTLFHSVHAQRTSTLVTACWLGVPVAGTSLYVADPYLTPRSLSTPLLLYAVSALLQRKHGRVVFAVLAAAAIHPIMAVWTCLLLALMVAVRAQRRARAVSGVVLAALACMAAVQWGVPADHGAALEAARSREYWFLARWQWFEWIGLVLPVGMLAFCALRTTSFSVATRELSSATAASVGVAMAGSLLFVHESSTHMMLSRLQPMRLLHPAYLLLAVILGGLVARGTSLRANFGWIAAGAGGVGLLAMQLALFPASGHWELPWTASRNQYVQAFTWIRHNTPNGAVVAMDARYIAAPGEDAQGFRAAALRAALPDIAKDGGIASVVPDLAAEWEAGSDAQTALSAMNDFARKQRVSPLGATWIVLPVQAATGLNCPYTNRTAKVCRL